MSELEKMFTKDEYYIDSLDSFYKLCSDALFSHIKNLNS